MSQGVGPVIDDCVQCDRKKVHLTLMIMHEFTGPGSLFLCTDILGGTKLRATK